MKKIVSERLQPMKNLVQLLIWFIFFYGISNSRDFFKNANATLWKNGRETIRPITMDKEVHTFSKVISLNINVIA